MTVIFLLLSVYITIVRASETEPPLIPDGSPVVVTHSQDVVKIYYGTKLYINCGLNESVIEEGDDNKSGSITDAFVKDEKNNLPLQGLKWFNTTGGTETEIVLTEKSESDEEGEEEAEEEEEEEEEEGQASKDIKVEMKKTWLYLTVPESKKTAENNALLGTYECRFNGKVVSSFRAIHALKMKKLERSYTVMEGEDLKMYCEVEEPKPDDFKLSWFYDENAEGSTEESRKPVNASSSLSNEEPHIKLLSKDGIPNAVLKIEDAVYSDRAFYFCVAETEEETVTMGTLVRVKDKYAALWPFLGIVAEVIVLCFIILLCEKKNVKGGGEDEEDEDPNAIATSGTSGAIDNANLRQRK